MNAQLVGADASSESSAEKVDQMINSHYACIRAHPRYRHALVVLCIENNYGGALAADRLATHLSRTYGPMWVRSRDPTNNDRKGIWTDDTMKQSYTLSLRNVLSNSLLHSVQFESFITTQLNSEGHKDPDAILEKIYKQLAFYRLEVDYKDDNPFSKPRMIITGKAPQRKDDLAFALSMSVHWNCVTRTEDQFLALADSKGLVLG